MKNLSIESEKLLEEFIKLDSKSKNAPICYRCFSVTHDDINKISNSKGLIKVNSTNGIIDINSTKIYNKLMRENIKIFELINEKLIVQHASPFLKEYKDTQAFKNVASEFDFMNNISTNGYIYCYFLTEKGRNYFRNKKRTQAKTVLWDYALPLVISISTFIVALLSLLKAFGKI